MPLGSKGGQKHPGLCEEKNCQQVQRGDPTFLLCAGEDTYGVLGSAPGLSVQEKHRDTGESPAKGQ